MTAKGATEKKESLFGELSKGASSEVKRSTEVENQQVPVGKPEASERRGIAKMER